MVKNTISYKYYIKDHLGNNRVVADHQGNVMQYTHYYPYGGMLHLSTNPGYQKFKYNGKEYDTMHGLNEYDYGARQYDPAIARFTSMDPLCEKYYHISPYAYCGGNPVKSIDLNGDSISVSTEDRELFKKCLSDIFGDFANGFEFNDSGMLIYNGTTKGMNKEMKKLFSGISDLISAQAVTRVIFGNQSDDISNDELNKNCGGVCNTIVDKKSRLLSCTILIDPNASDSFKVNEVTQQYYAYRGKPHLGIDMFIPKTCTTNITDRLFHEFGENIYYNSNKYNVIQYNNYARKLLNLPERKADEYHNRLIKH